MEIVEFKLAELVNPEKTDSISGRSFGEGYADKIKFMDLLEKNVVVKFVVDETVVKAINDSFIKGLFSKAFEKYKSIDKVATHVEVDANDYFKKLFEKNWLILQDIYNV